MKASLVENRGDGKVAYESLVVAPRKLSVFNSDLALRIVNELVNTPGCAMDLARNLKEHEQKIYYHLRKLEDVGVVKPIGTEKRYGMTAKIYSMTCPVIATKLYEDGHPLEKSPSVRDHSAMKFFYPFIEDGELTAKIVIGDPNEHGRFDRKSKEGSYLTDFAILIGSFVNKYKFPYYKIDTEVNQKDLKGNLILIGNIRTNVVMDKIKKHLPIKFLEEGQFSFISKNSNKRFTDPRTGFIIKIKNPFNPENFILAIGGLRTRGARAAMIALTKNMDKINNKNESDENILRVVKGFDRTGDSVIDSVEFIE
ncbi:MAG: ArsR family transcriptional regulator [Candidatus Aenigmarchaeota archaeon]|nr:ArsR family transcriptional regulator [Candidatus Aenigmarchaeota archaeon]